MNLLDEVRRNYPISWPSVAAGMQRRWLCRPRTAEAITASAWSAACAVARWNTERCAIMLVDEFRAQWGRILWSARPSGMIWQTCRGDDE